MPERLDLAGDDAEQSDLLAEFVRGVHQYAQEGIRADRIDAERHIPRFVLEDLAFMGAFGLTLPVAYGGAGLGMRAACAVVAALASHDRSIATTVGLHLGLGTRALVCAGSDEQRAAHLPDLAAGSRIAAFCTTEPDAGSDLMAMRTSARATADGWHIAGTKAFVTNAHLAGVFTVAAATPRPDGSRAGHGLFLVLPGDPGVSVGAEEHKLGLRGSSTATLNLDDVALPPGRALGPPGDGMGLIHESLRWGRTILAAGCTGSARRALELARRHVSERRQFNKPLLAQEVVREQLSRAAAGLYAAEALVRSVGSAPTADVEARSIAAKVFASEESWRIADLAVQLFGGYGYIEETGAALLLRDARVPRIFEGANDVLCTRLGLTWATRPPALPLPELDADPALALARACWQQASDIAEESSRRWGVRLALRPRDLHRIGRAAVLAHAAAAAAQRANAAATPEDAEIAAIAVERCWLGLAYVRADATPLVAPRWLETP